MKSVPVCLFTLVIVPCWVWSESIYLEGISVVGAEKNAFISWEGGKVRVSEGDAVGMWHVKQIAQESVLLTATGGQQTMLPLHARLESVEVTVPEDGFSPESDEIPENAAAVEIEAPPEPVPSKTFQRHIISDEDIPPGHHKVHTPFGDFLVKDDPVTEKPNQSVVNSLPPPPTVKPLEIAPANGEIPPGYRKVKTPFGDFLLEEPKK